MSGGKCCPECGYPMKEKQLLCVVCMVAINQLRTIHLRPPRDESNRQKPRLYPEDWFTNYGLDDYAQGRKSEE